MTVPELSIVIVNWNSREFLRSCLESIPRGSRSVNCEIIVVDSASFDGSEDMLRMNFPDVLFIQSPENIGFARANNLGAGRAKGKVLLFLNPDTLVRPGAIEELLESVKRLPTAGVVGCRLLNTDGSLQRSCVQLMPTILNQVLDLDVLQRWFPNGRLWVSGATYEGSEAPVEVEAVSGACMMIRRDVFDRVAGFSTDYFMYAEDLDLCWKVRETGLANYYVSMAEIVHHGGGSTRKKRSRFSDVMIPESNSRFLGKARGHTYGATYRAALTAAAAIRLLLLTLFVPIWIIAGKTSDWTTVFGKWSSVLSWGLGLESWAKKPPL